MVRVWGAPPSDDTLERPTPAWAVSVKKIVPSSDHVPPRSSSASQSVTGAPPETETFFSFPSAKNAIQSPTGEKNGSFAPSVPEDLGN